MFIDGRHTELALKSCRVPSGITDFVTSNNGLATETQDVELLQDYHHSGESFGTGFEATATFSPSCENTFDAENGLLCHCRECIDRWSSSSGKY